MSSIPRPGEVEPPFPPLPGSTPAGGSSAVFPSGGGSAAGGRSFARAVAPRFLGGNAFVSPIPLSFANLNGGACPNGDPVGIKIPAVIDGCPTIQLSKEELATLAKPLELSLVGKFGLGRPKWDALVRFFRNLRLFGNFNLASLDSKHCLITLYNLDDYTRIFSKGSYLVNNFNMKVFKWTSDFSPNAEPALIPVWITLPGIGAQMYTQNILFSIASAFGKPLKVAYSTAKGLRGDQARVLVEVDILKNHPTHVALGEGEGNVRQEVVMDPLPKYCTGCKKVGHDNVVCFVLQPHLKMEYVKARDAKKVMKISQLRNSKVQSGHGHALEVP